VGWTFMKRVALTGPEAVSSILIQVVVLDDLIEEDDKRYLPICDMRDMPCSTLLPLYPAACSMV
jgi:hypothetical protein